jgi:hypothetical protein
VLSSSDDEQESSIPPNKVPRFRSTSVQKSRKDACKSDEIASAEVGGSVLNNSDLSVMFQLSQPAFEGQHENDEDDVAASQTEQATDANEQEYGFLQQQIVGMRYYKGVVSLRMHTC